MSRYSKLKQKSPNAQAAESKPSGVGAAAVVSAITAAAISTAVKGVGEAVGLPGAAGVRGPAGPVGPIGPAGPPGADGLVGPTTPGLVTYLDNTELLTTSFGVVGPVGLKHQFSLSAFTGAKPADMPLATHFVASAPQVECQELADGAPSVKWDFGEGFIEHIAGGNWGACGSLLPVAEFTNVLAGCYRHELGNHTVTMRLRVTWYSVEPDPN